MRAVLDPNVLISAILSPAGTPARILLAWQHGAFELVLSPLLIAELRRVLRYPKLRDRVAPADARAFVSWLERTATRAEDPSGPPPAESVDPGDGYLLALAATARAALVSGDKHLLALADDMPIFTPADFLHELDAGPRQPSTP